MLDQKINEIESQLQPSENKIRRMKYKEKMKNKIKSNDLQKQKKMLKEKNQNN